MTDPSWHDPAEPGPHSPPPGYPPQYPQYPAPNFDPSAPYGRHPVTGQPYSDKSKLTAGLLELLALVGIGGIGRFYIGDTGIGVAQLLTGLCGIGLIWSIVDGVLMLVGSVNDSQGRPLRDGT
ncbi:TM2 domain-containing protein [Mycobacterium rhizamassiliense]|uniref:TM2 domain-containing protein n=1 Tax=Mycobacterium rhizamassiliense TaxID=1841860 RepID=UPI00097D7305|nr:TM2 domain-containing protein [Mycobacterium rhizamassiliense]